MNAHTPGPWRTLGESTIVRVADEDFIACAYPCGDDDRERYANARLIAAAPELLEMLKMMWDGYDMGDAAFDDDGNFSGYGIHLSDEAEEKIRELINRLSPRGTDAIAAAEGGER